MKAAIIYLVKSSPDGVRDLKRSLALLKRNFLRRFPYPVLIFHEECFTDEWKREILEPGFQWRSLIGHYPVWGMLQGYLGFDSLIDHAASIRIVPAKQEFDIRFVPVRFEVPPFLDSTAIPRLYNDRYTMGYRHMCRFFSGTVYQHPALAEFDYYWRLDTDSYLIGRVPNDPFRFMHERDLVYGYNYCPVDDERYVRGLAEATERYIRERGIEPKFLHRFQREGRYDGSCFYSNFELGRLDFFRSAPYQDFFDYLDRLGGIYTGRWGDAPIHLLGVSLFVDEARTHMFRDIAYNHKPLWISPRSGIHCEWGKGYQPAVPELVQ